MTEIQNRMAKSFLAILLVGLLLRPSTGQGGAYLSIRGAAIANNGYVDYDDIGGDNDLTALLCNTPNEDCCSQNGQGNWYFPDGTQVLTFQQNGGSAGAPFFSIGRGSSKVRLYRVNSHTSHATQRGRFYCTIPEYTGEAYLYANILDIGAVHITYPGRSSGTSGQKFCVECSVQILTQPNSPHPTFEWFHGPSNTTLPSSVAPSPITMTGITYTSTLEFSPLLQSHAGTYTCRVGGNERLAANTIITVIDSSITVTVTDSGTQPVTGQDYSLECNVVGANNFTREWKKNDVVLPQVLQNPVLRFTPFNLSDAGQYTCEVNVKGEIYTDEAFVVKSQIPAPTSVDITSNPSSPIWPVGSDVTLTCTVMLSPAINVPVTVNIVWTTPEGSIITQTAQSIAGSTTTYASTVTLNSFGRDKSGLYTCTAAIHPISLFLLTSRGLSTTKRITTGVYLSLNGTNYRNNSAIDIRNIGNSFGNTQLTCHTDRKPCCSQLPHRHGQWRYPNGALVPTLGAAMNFYRNRGDEGTVLLNRLHNNITSPTGLFCCEVPEASGITQSRCAHIVPGPISVQVFHNGVVNEPIIGEDYTITCSFSGYEDHTWTKEPVAVIKWTKNNGTLTQLTTTTNNLAFSSLRLSDAGVYTCAMDLYDGTVLLSSGRASTTIYITIPPSEVTLVTDTVHQPILSQSNVTLVCSVEFSPLVDAAVTVYTNFTGPHSGQITTATMEKHTKYVGRADLTNMKPSHSGTYRCESSAISSSPYIRRAQNSGAANKHLAIGDGHFQLNLLDVSDCKTWHYHAYTYQAHIEKAIFEILELRCQCNIPRSNLLDGKFSCRNSNNHVTYRSTLIGTHNTNASQLLNFLQDWVSSGPTIEMDWYYVDINSSCPVAISSLTEPECGAGPK